MTDNVAFKWEFPAYFRTHAFGWGGSRLACQRIKEAVSEIKKVHRQDPMLAAEGAVVFLGKVAPALEQVDSSSGALGSAVRNAVGVLVPMIALAQVSRKVRDRWLDRIWSAVEKDGVCYLDGMGDRWGELCGGPDVASSWADRIAVEAAERTGGKEQVAAQIADLLAKDRSVGKFVQKSLGVFQRR